MRRRTRVARLLPNEASFLRLVSALLMDIAKDWQIADKRYITVSNRENAKGARLIFLTDGTNSVSRNPRLKAEYQADLSKPSLAVYVAIGSSRQCRQVGSGSVPPYNFLVA